MKTTAKFTLLFVLVGCGTSNLVGCTYEAPQANGSIGGGGSGGDASSSSTGQGGSAGQSSGGAGGSAGASSSSSSGSGGQAGSGGGTCTPKETMICTKYTGPANTEGKGTCVASIAPCSESGTWLACQPEVLPARENCSGTVDTNCDGIMPCTGTPIGSYPFQSAQTPNSDFILALTSDVGPMGRDGSVYAVGGKNGSAMDPPNNLRVLMWHRDSDGMLHDWSGQFVLGQPSAANGAIATGVVVNPSTGTIFVSGTYFGGSLQIGSVQLPASGTPTSFLAQFSKTGTVVNAIPINSGGAMSIKAMTVDVSGKMYIAGNYQGTPVVDAMPFPSAATTKGFVMGVDLNGIGIWHQPFTGLGSHDVTAITVMDNNNIIIATEFVGAVDVKPAAGQIKTVDAGPIPDIMVSRLRNADGLTQWNAIIAGDGVGGKMATGGLAANGTKVTVGGRFLKQVLIGVKSYSNMEADGTTDSFVASYDATTGNLTNHFVSGGPGVQDFRAITLDSASDVIITGAYSMTLPMPGAALTTSDGVDAFVYKASADLNGRWVQRFSGGDTQAAQAVVVGKGIGNIFVGGTFIGQLGGINPGLTSQGTYDAFLLELAN